MNDRRKVLQPVTQKRLPITTYTPTTANQTIKAGSILLGDQTVAGDADLTAANIKAGVTIFDVVGTFSSVGSSGSVNVLNINHNSYAVAGACSSDGKYIFIVRYTSGTSFYLYVSSDYGVTWTQRLSYNTGNYNKVVCSESGQYVLATYSNTSGYIYYSSDYGASFSNVTVAASQQLETVCMNEDASYFYTLSYTNGHLYRSTDYGSNWTDVLNIGQNTVIDCDSTGAIVFKQTSGSFTVYKSTDYGASFSSTGIDNYFWSLMVSSDGNRFVYSVASGGSRQIYLRIISPAANVYLGVAVDGGSVCFMGRDGLFAIDSHDVSTPAYLATIYTISGTTATAVNTGFYNATAQGFLRFSTCRGKFGIGIFAGVAYKIQTQA